MTIQHGEYKDFAILLHGGAGPQDPSKTGVQRATKALNRIANGATRWIEQGKSAPEIVCGCLVAMEKDPQFNAGIGSALQQDGRIRVSASIMDGEGQSFSGIISAEDINFPSKLALVLQTRNSRVLTQPGSQLLARKCEQPLNTNLTQQRLNQWIEKSGSGEDCDTVGCVVILPKSKTSAGSSTGGRGFEFPGRVSDSATVAGNYASRHLAVTATGIGEEIVDDAMAARLETRVRDGMDLKLAAERSFEEAQELKRSYGWIAADPNGAWNIAYTTPSMSYVVLDSTGVVSSSS